MRFCLHSGNAHVLVCALAVIDLSAAFDVVDVELLIKQLTILGLPGDVIHLNKIWLKEWFFYVCVNGSESISVF